MKKRGQRSQRQLAGNLQLITNRPMPASHPWLHRTVLSTSLCKALSTRADRFLPQRCASDERLIYQPSREATQLDCWLGYSFLIYIARMRMYSLKQSDILRSDQDSRYSTVNEHANLGDSQPRKEKILQVGKSGRSANPADRQKSNYHGSKKPRYSSRSIVKYIQMSLNHAIGYAKVEAISCSFGPTFPFCLSS